MSSTRMTSALLGATALGFAFAAPALAQTTDQPTEADACDALTQMIDEAGDGVSPDFADAAEVAKMSDGNACLLYIDRVEKAGGMTALTPTEGSGAATAQGEAGQSEAGQGEMQADAKAVDSDQEQTGQSGEQQTDQQETAQQGSAQSEQAATSDQGGTQDAASTTAQTTTDTAEQDTAGQDTAQQDTAQQDTAQQDTAQGTSGDDTAQQTTEQGADQQEAADSSAGEQDTAEQDTAEQDTAEQDTAEQGTAEQDTAEQGTTEQVTTEPTAGESSDQPAATAEAEPFGTEVVVADITGRDVVTPEGDDIGEIDRILVVDGEPYAIFKRGGFLGFGSEEVAIPAAQLEMRGEDLILTGISPDDFDAMPEFEAEAESELASEDMVRIGAAE